MSIACSFSFVQDNRVQLSQLPKHLPAATSAYRTVFRFEDRNTTAKRSEKEIPFSSYHSPKDLIITQAL